jgi:hypothetical protein
LDTMEPALDAKFSHPRGWLNLALHGIKLLCFCEYMAEI